METPFGVVFTTFMVYYGKELANFGYVMGIFFYGNLIILRISEL